MAWAQVGPRAMSTELSFTAPRISDLVRGKIDLFSIDALVNMLSAAGLHVDVTVRPAKAS